ncbi:MAG TPA: LysM domain-containing protein, partial [Archangium sp.]|nr:LysM domain-containing protein [Archangium sp.]
MSSYRIKSGDTLSAIARRNQTSVGALMKANPQIKNANLIIAGKTLNIPGSRDSYDGGQSRPAGGGGRPSGTGGGRPTQQTQGTGGTTGPVS